MNHEPFETLAAGYALGALDGQDLVEFEAHLAAGCRECERTLQDSREALAALAGERPPVVPPPEVKAALLRRVRGDARGQPSRPAPRRPWIGWVAAAAAAVAVAVLSGTYVAGRYEARLAALARETDAIRQRLEQEEAAVRDLAVLSRTVTEVLSDPAARVVALRGQGSIPAADGRLVWSETSGGYLVVSRLPAAPEGRAYELWTIRGGVPAPAGVFRPDAAGRALHRVDPTGTPVDVFAVTIEPATGVPKPTGPIVLASK